MNSCLEIQLKTDCAIQVKKYINQYFRVKAFVVNDNTIRVYYNSETLPDKRILKIIQQAQGTGKRTRNVEHIKQINESED